jgi:outer membrane biogenesis lipoprotein LolB
MSWKAESSLARLPVCLCLLVLLTFSGCARQPWTDPLEGDQFAETGQLIDALARADQACGKSLDGDLALFYSDPLGKKALSGYLQFSMPSSYKFVVSNPFGQPVLAIAGDQRAYQAINVPEQQYLAGSIRSFGLRNDLPVDIMKGSWGEWITARNLRSSQSITAIRRDREDRGVWISFRHEKSEPPGLSHLLLEPDSRLPLIRILENGDGTIVAEVTYGDWVTQAGCRQPQEITITGLDYGTDIRLKLANVRLTEEPKQFHLPVPPGYAQQLRP